MRTPHDITGELLSLANESYRLFQSKLMPTVPPDKILGIRMPILRAYAKTLQEDEIAAFIRALPHRYYDEDNLHGLLLANKKNVGELLPLLDAFLPHVDNWATCDMLRPKIFAQNTELLYPFVEKWLTSSHLYTRRYAIGLLLSFYLQEAFRPLHLDTVAAIVTDEYYLQMMIAWYFATALAFRWKETLPYLEKRLLSPTVHKMTLRKAMESYRITQGQKAILKALF